MGSKITFDNDFLFSTDLVIRASDVNYGGHLGNDSVLTLMQEARIEYYRALGFKDETSFEGAVGQIIVDAHVEYKSEGFLGDLLTIQIGVRDIAKYGFQMVYRITNKASGKEVARGTTTNLCFDYAKRKVATIPVALLEKIKAPI